MLNIVGLGEPLRTEELKPSDDLFRAIGNYITSSSTIPDTGTDVRVLYRGILGIGKYGKPVYSLDLVDSNSGTTESLAVKENCEPRMSTIEAYALNGLQERGIQALETVYVEGRFLIQRRELGIRSREYLSSTGGCLRSTMFTLGKRMIAVHQALDEMLTDSDKAYLESMKVSALAAQVPYAYGYELTEHFYSYRAMYALGPDLDPNFRTFYRVINDILKDSRKEWVFDCRPENAFHRITDEDHMLVSGDLNRITNDPSAIDYVHIFDAIPQRFFHLEATDFLIFTILESYRKKRKKSGEDTTDIIDAMRYLQRYESDVPIDEVISPERISPGRILQSASVATDILEIGLGNELGRQEAITLYAARIHRNLLEMGGAIKEAEFYRETESLLKNELGNTEYMPLIDLLNKGQLLYRGRLFPGRIIRSDFIPNIGVIDNAPRHLMRTAELFRLNAVYSLDELTKLMPNSDFSGLQKFLEESKVQSPD
jgi:hypothetical protein